MQRNQPRYQKFTWSCMLYLYYLHFIRGGGNKSHYNDWSKQHRGKTAGFWWVESRNYSFCN